MQTVRPLGRLGQAVTPRRLWVAAAVAALAVAEVVGRRLEDDLQDGALLAGLGVLAWLGLRDEHGVPRRAAHRVLTRLRRVGRALQRHVWVEVGVDLRGTPPLPRASMGWHGVAARTLALALPAIVLLAWLRPFAWRPVATSVLYVGHLLLLGLLWALLLGGLALALFALGAWLHDLLVLRHRRRGRRSLRREIVLDVVGVAVLLVLATWLPVAVATALPWVATVFVLVVLARPGALDATLLWRHRRPPRAMRATSWRRAFGEELVLFTALHTVLTVLAVGGRSLGLPGRGDDALWLTEHLGMAFAWGAGAALAVGAGWVGWGVLRMQQEDPARPCATRIHLRGPTEAVRAARRRLRAAGFGVRGAGQTARPDDVPLVVVASDMPPLAEPPRWPLTVSPAALALPEMHALLRRRDRVQRRRRLVRALELLFRARARQRGGAHRGCLIAPHLWFVDGMHRDDEEAEDPEAVLSTRIGPTWRRLLGRAPRQHMHEMLRVLDVDLLYVSDAVSFRRFRRVLRVLFERYDVERAPLRPHHLAGVPGVACLLDDHGPERRWTHERWSEPAYDEIGRARVLLVMPEPGGEEASVPEPDEDAGRPLPAPAPALQG